MTALQKEARLHERTVQEIARQALSKVQGAHTSSGATGTTAVNGSKERAISTKEYNVAQRVNITLVDDLDGTDASETVIFGLDGTNYEIDLSEQNAKELRSRLDDFVVVARRVTGRKKPAKGKHAPADVRRWAQEQGMTVSNRGVVPADVVKAYEAAH